MNTQDVVWDGKFHSYRPRDDWRSRIAPSLVLHEDQDQDLDPISYEVIRHRLWTINLAHGDTVTRVSGSPVFQSLDFNMCILTEDGEIVMNAPYLQYLDAPAPLAIRYILENLSGDPGIHEGDVLVTNDPWIGAVHQMDVLLAMPVFVDDKLFAWVSNAGHQYDLGGVTPGGWPQNAENVFFDPVVLPPFKLIDRGKMRPDLEALYLRQSRMPDLIALDLRAQIAGCRFAAEQLQATCAEFGPATVKAGMRRVLDAAQESFKAKLQRIPDGRWSDVRYFDEKLPGDRGTQRVQLNLEKKGDRIRMDNQGTQVQEVGPNGSTFCGLSGACLGALTITLLNDQLFAMGGAARQVDFDFEPGSLTCVDYPAAVSGGVLNVVASFHMMMSLVVKMLAADPELARDAIAPSPDLSLFLLAGVDDRGRQFGSAVTDELGSGNGARSWRDGIDTGGPPWDVLGRYSNAEEFEAFYPLVMLYRRQVLDGSGAGRWRGGGTTEFAVAEYRSASVTLITNTGSMAASCQSAPGLMGGYPSGTHQTSVLTGTNLQELFKERRVPLAGDEVEARATHILRGKDNGMAIGPGDVAIGRMGGGSSHGDPLLREPERVAADVVDGWVSIKAARDVYGVVTDPSGVIDQEATAAARGDILADRSRWAKVQKSVDPHDDVRIGASGRESRLVHEYIEAVERDGEYVLACTRCGEVLAPYCGDFKSNLLVKESPVTEIPLVADPSRFLDCDVVFRRFCCPGCQVLMTTEVVMADEPPVPEMRLAAVD